MKKFSSIFLSLVMIFTFATPTFAAPITTENYNLYTNEESETVMIDGTSYTYYFYYINGNRAVDIINNDSGHTDKLVYNSTTSEMYLNDNQFSTINNITSNNITSLRSRAFTNGWKSLGKSSHYISWLKGTTTAIVAGAIAIYLGTLGPAGVIAAIGIGSLGILAASSSGGTITVEGQWLHLPFTAPQYRFIWSFRASTGDKYGPYVSHVTNI